MAEFRALNAMTIYVQWPFTDRRATGATRPFIDSPTHEVGVFPSGRGVSLDSQFRPWQYRCAYPLLVWHLFRLSALLTLGPLLPVVDAVRPSYRPQ